MRFDVLGPMQVWSGGQDLRIAGRLQLVLLGVLLTRANTFVPVDVLTDAMWGARRNARAAANLHVHVHRLRRALGEPNRLSVAPGTPSGYRLAVAPGELDAERFDWLIDQSVELRATEPQRAGTLIRDALGLWRGEPFSDVDVPLLANESRRLTERRMIGIEELYTAELACGRHALVTAELTELVGSHPLRERLRGLLMQALFRLGRPADALEVYQTGRTRMVEELGIEPGPALRRLHQLILTGGRDDADSPDPVPVVRVQQVHGPMWFHDPPVRVPSTFFGVTLHSTTGAMPDFQIGALRLWNCDCRWANVQPRKDTFEWTLLDRLVAAAERAGLPCTYTLGMPAGWACPNGKRTLYEDDSRAAPPDDLDDWDAYVRAVVTRYRGRIEAYELWDYASSPLLYDGTVETLVELVRRAATIIRTLDPEALVVAPSLGDLWEPAGQEVLASFASKGGYEHCDVGAFKLHPRTASGPPETVVELVDLVDRIMHHSGVHVPLWSTGPELTSVTVPRFSEERAGAYAVRHFLAGVCARLERTYFYNWGGRRIPIVLQPDGGTPTEAAGFVERLQRWLSNARVRSCSHGLEGGLPANVWRLSLALDGGGSGADRPEGAEGADILWTTHGTATMSAERRVDLVERLDGTRTRPSPDAPLTVTETPALFHFRSM